MPRYKTELFVDEEQNIVLRTDIIYTPAEFLTMNREVFEFAESMGQVRKLPIQGDPLLEKKP